MGKTNLIKNINDYFDDFKNIKNAKLLDVRSPEEYHQGHIPGSVNIPLQSLEDVRQLIDDSNIPLYVYCRSGARSARAVSLLHSMGYSNAINIGGILNYKGELSY